MTGNKIELLELDDSRWVDFVHARSDASPFHHPAWAQLLAECYGYRASAVALVRFGDMIVCGIPAIEVKGFGRKRRWVALPYTDECPLLSTGNADRSAFARAFVQHHDEPLEIRDEVPDDAARTRVVGVRHTLELAPDSSAVFRTFKRKQVQQPIVKAEKGGALTVRPADSWQTAVDTFYRLHVSTRRRLGTPVQPKRYFRLLWERLVEPGLAFILVAYAGERAAAAAVFLTWNQTVIYKYSASDPELWHTRPNNLVLWNAIRWGCENGYRLFDFGRTEADNEGLRTFKRGWGTTESDLVYSALGGTQVEPAGAGAMSFVRPVIQHMPDWFCRLVGELAYRYAT